MRNTRVCLLLIVVVMMTRTRIVSGSNIPFLDMIPVVSQIKTVIQMATGDMKGAETTKSNFENDGIGPSQINSAILFFNGKPVEAYKNQGKFLSNLEGLVDSTPLVGHIKGGIHLLNGDHDHGWNAIKSATSTTGTVLGAAALGPLGAVGGHLATDMAITMADFALNGNKSQPHGTIEYFQNLKNKTSSEHFDAIAGLVVDGLTGGKVKSKSEALSTQFKNIRHSSERVKELSEGISLKTLSQHEEEVPLLAEKSNVQDSLSDHVDTIQHSSKRVKELSEGISLKTLSQHEEEVQLLEEKSNVQDSISAHVDTIQHSSERVKKLSEGISLKSLSKHEEKVPTLEEKSNVQDSLSAHVDTIKHSSESVRKLSEGIALKSMSEHEEEVPLLEEKSNVDSLSAHVDTIKHSSEGVRKLSEETSLKSLSEHEEKVPTLEEKSNVQDSLSAHVDTIKHSSESVRKLSEGISLKSLSEHEEKVSMLEEKGDSLEWSDYYDESLKLDNVREESVPDSGSSDVSLDLLEGKIKSSNLGASVPDKPVSSPDSRATSPDIRVVSRAPSDHSSGTWVESDSPEVSVEPQSIETRNTQTAKQFLDFLKNDRLYAKFNLARFLLEKVDMESFREDDIFSHRFEHFFLDVEHLTNKLQYLSDDEKSLISKHDFRLVNKNMEDTDGMLSSLAGIAKKDVKTIHKQLTKTSDEGTPLMDKSPNFYLSEYRKQKQMSLYSSNELSGVKELNIYLTTHIDFLEGKKVIVNQKIGPEDINAFVLKMKKIKGNMNFAKLFIDFKVPAFVRRGLPNPYRFTTYLEHPDDTYVVNVIGKGENFS